MNLKLITACISPLLFSVFSYSQCLGVGGPCLMDVQASSTTICVGQSVNLDAYTGVQSLGNDFNNSTIGTGWITNNNVVNFNNPCGPGLDGTAHVWFGSAAGTGTRLLQTIDFNTTLGGNICFDFKMATQGGSNPCEGPDEADEGVSLQYSTDGGISWIDITYFSPSGNLLPSNPGGNNSVATGATAFTVWANYSFPIPPAAMTTSTRFRWFQPFNSSATNDHWGIDNVSVITNQMTGSVPGFIWVDNGQLINGTRVVSPTQTTTYIAEWNNAGTICRDSVTIVVNPIPTTPSFSPITVCQGVPFSLTPTPLVSGHSYVWTGTNGVVSSAVPFNNIGSSVWNGTQMSLVAIANGCTSSVFTQTITVNIPPTITIIGDTSGCEGVPTTLTVTPSALDSIVWAHGAYGTPVMVVPGATYTATGYLNGCPGTDAHTIAAAPNPLTVTNNNPFCANRTNQISVTSGKVSYVWNGQAGGDSFVITGNTPNPIILTVENTNGCVRTDSIPFTLLAVPDIGFTPTSMCGGLTIPFQNTTQITPPANIAGYIWNFGDGTTSSDVNPQHDFPTGGSYNMSLVAVSDQNCVDTLSIEFRVHPKPVADFIASPLCFGLYLFNDSTILGDTTVSTYTWTFDINNDTMTTEMFEYQFPETVNEVEVHYVITDGFGCTDDTTKIIQIESPPQFSKLPNIITPDLNGLNDKFEIPSSFDKCYDYSIRFFNRWGQKVYEITHSSMAFDGNNSAGQKLEDGVYYYVIMADGKKVVNGTVTVVR